MGTQRCSQMLGSAVSSSTPTDFQPRSTIGLSEFPLMNRQGPAPGPTLGCPYCAVGMHRALESAIGFSRTSTHTWWMLAFLTPAEVRRSLKMPPDSSATERSDVQTWDHRGTHRGRTRQNYLHRPLAPQIRIERTQHRTHRGRTGRGPGLNHFMGHFA